MAPWKDCLRSEGGLTQQASSTVGRGNVVNDKTIEPIALELFDKATAADVTTAFAEIEIKKLAKHFQKGINRFQVAYGDGQERTGTEVLVEIQM